MSVLVVRTKSIGTLQLVNLLTQVREAHGREAMLRLFPPDKRKVAHMTPEERTETHSRAVQLMGGYLFTLFDKAGHYKTAAGPTPEVAAKYRHKECGFVAYAWSTTPVTTLTARAVFDEAVRIHALVKPENSTPTGRVIDEATRFQPYQKAVFEKLVMPSKDAEFLEQHKSIAIEMGRVAHKAVKKAGEIDPNRKLASSVICDQVKWPPASWNVRDMNEAEKEVVKSAQVFRDGGPIGTRKHEYGDKEGYYSITVSPGGVVSGGYTLYATGGVVDQMMADGYGTRRPGPAGLLTVAPLPNAWGRT